MSHALAMHDVAYVTALSLSILCFPPPSPRCQLINRQSLAGLNPLLFTRDAADAAGPW